MRRSLFRHALTGACLLAALPTAARTVEVKLDEAITRAVAVQPSMVEAEGSRRTAGADARSALGAFLPTVSTSASASRSNVGRIDSQTGRLVEPEFTYTLGWNANLQLFDGFARFAERRTAVASVEAADAGLRDAHFQVILATKQVFYTAAASDELVRVATAQLERSQDQFKAAVDKLQTGAGTVSDSLRATVDTGNARIALLRARAANAAAQADLGRQIGADGPARAVPDTSLPALPDTNTVARVALAESPTVLRSEAQARAAEAQVSSARSRYWPALGVSYNDNRQGPGDPFTNLSDYSRTSSWRFALSWPIFDGFDREGAQVQADVQRDVANARLEDARRQVRADVTRQVALLTAAYEQIDIAALNVAAAREEFRVQDQRYRLGVATALDLSTSQANLTQAEVDFIQARFDYLVARAQLETLVGREL